MQTQHRRWIAWALAGVLVISSGTALAQGAVAPEYRWLTFAVFSAIIAWIFLDEAIALRQAVAMGVVIGSLVVIVRGQSTAAKAAAAHRAVLDPAQPDGPK